MIFQLQDKEILIEEVRKRLDKKSMKYNLEILSQFIDSKASAINKIKSEKDTSPRITTITDSTIRDWVKGFVRTYCHEFL